MTYDLTLGIGAFLYGAMDRILNAVDKDGNPISLPFKTKYAFQRNMEFLKKPVEDYDRTSLIALAMWGTMNEETKDVELIGEEAHMMYDAMLCEKASEPLDIQFMRIPLLEFNRLMDQEMFINLDEVNLFHVYLVDDPEFIEKVRTNMEAKIQEESPESQEKQPDTENI